MFEAFLTEYSQKDFATICTEYRKLSGEAIVERFRGEFQGTDLLIAQLVYWRMHDVAAFVKLALNAGADPAAVLLVRNELVWTGSQEQLPQGIRPFIRAQ